MHGKLTAPAHRQVISRASYKCQICAVDKVLQIKPSLLNLRGLTVNHMKNLHPMALILCYNMHAFKGIRVLHHCHFFL